MAGLSAGFEITMRSPAHGDKRYALKVTASPIEVCQAGSIERLALAKAEFLGPTARRRSSW